MDVKALCTNIPHSDGVKVCEIFMIENGIPSMEITNVTQIIHFILTHNCFEFNDESYIQAHETAMGTKWPQHMQTYLYVNLKNIY